MNREEMNKLLGKTEEELDRIADAFENDEVDSLSSQLLKEADRHCSQSLWSQLQLGCLKALLLKLSNVQSKKGLRSLNTFVNLSDRI